MVHGVAVQVGTRHVQRDARGPLGVARRIQGHGDVVDTVRLLVCLALRLGPDGSRVPKSGPHHGHAQRAGQHDNKDARHPALPLVVLGGMRVGYGQGCYGGVQLRETLGPGLRRELELVFGSGLGHAVGLWLGIDFGLDTALVPFVRLLLDAGLGLGVRLGFRLWAGFRHRVERSRRFRPKPGLRRLLRRGVGNGHGGLVGPYGCIGLVGHIGLARLC